MNINDNLFNLIKSHNWDEFVKILNSSSDIDCNIRDNNNNYLIQYSVLYNKINITELLIKKGAKLDVLDIDGRSLLFIPIKYNYNEMLKKILENDKNSIGISLLEYSDNKGLFPIHYSILFKNIEATDIILIYLNNIDIPDNEGNTPLHLSIQVKDNNIFNKIINKNPDVDFQTNQGESPLHMACNFIQIEMVSKLLDKNSNVNIQDFDNQITPLMYSIILDDNRLFNLLIKSSDVNIQDINGDNALHYAINESNFIIINDLVDKFDNLASTNLIGKSPLHLLLDKLKSNNAELDKFNLTNLIKKSDLNVQDYNGNSPLILVIRLNLWKKIADLLKVKKLDAFLKNHENKNSISYVIDEDKESFYDLLTESYLNIIRTNNETKWKDDIDNFCKTNLSFQKFETVKEQINFNIDEKNIKKWDKDMCPFIIKQKIKNKKSSYPEKLKNYCIEIDYDRTIAFVTYTGVTLDILFGLIYILKNYNNITDTSLTIDFKENQNLKDHYIKYENRTVGDDEIINFEIIWNNQKIFFPSTLDNVINKFKNDVNKRFLVIPIGIELTNDSHANMLIFDKEKNELERFEPNGSSFPYKFNYNPVLLDKLLKDKFLSFFENLKYFRPIDYLPKIGFQLLESYDHYKTKKIGDPGGFCGAWCTWYAFMRVKYPNLDKIKLINKLIRKIKAENIPFKNLIRNFANKIVTVRDETFKDADLDINDWINANYSKAQLDRLIILIKQVIKEFNI